MDIRQQLLAAFEAEHREHVDVIRGALAAGDAGGAPDWNDVFRRAHSLKGAARAVDLPAVEAVAHRLETLFERIRSGAARLDRAAVSATHLALDRIEAIAADIHHGPHPVPADALDALDRCLGTAGPAQDRPAPDTSPRPGAIEPPAPSTEPPVPSVPSAQLPSSEPEAEAGTAVLRVPAAAVEALTRATHGLTDALGGEAVVAEGLRRIAAAAGALRQRFAPLTEGRAAGAPAPSGALRAELAALEAGLSSLAREANDLLRNQAGAAAALEAAAGRVREETERLALVPAETAFGGFARSLRETARAAGREIEVTARGLDLPVDRALLQILKDPVLHALRNAVSHGAESPEIRARAGKPPALAVRLEVGVRGGKLVIAVHDDGCGPDLAAIAVRARESGLLAPGEAAGPERLLALVFEPGFSTASAVDTLAGRGIGLAVVAEAARRLHGSARLEPRRPYGTSLVLALPLSAARRPLLLVEAAGGCYALPSAACARLTRLDRRTLDTVMGRPVAPPEEAGGTALPVVALADLLGLAEAAPGETVFSAILLQAGGRRCLLEVTRLSEVRTHLVLPAPPLVDPSGPVSGTIIVGGDTPVLVLDPERLIARASEGGAGPTRSPRQTPAGPGGTLGGKRRSTILVVDDSITTRTLEKSILEAAGYRVVVCVDGQDALDQLRAGIEPVDLVVADVEMPRLDGFGLVAALRADPAFAALPVILMTSRGASEDVARGLELGADAYLTKQKFDQRELLETVGQLL